MPIAPLNDPEPPLDPELPIIDPHHHFWANAHGSYLPADFLADAASGHDIRATIHIECRSAYREDGPEALRPVGETAWIVGLTPHGDGGPGGPAPPRLAAGIVGHADLMLGDAVSAVLEAHITAGAGRFRGIRYSTVSHRDPAAQGAMINRPPGLMAEPAFRAGFARLAPHGLSFDAWLYHTQIGELTALARAFPQTIVVLDHLGGVLGIGPYAGRRDEVFARWAADLAELARAPNARIKIGGLGMRLWGFSYDAATAMRGSQVLAAAWRPYVETAIELFGPKRAMFESNFPVDKVAYRYTVGWNAFSRICAAASADERAWLFSQTAQQTYRI